MARRPTYGEQMAEIENTREEAIWYKKLIFCLTYPNPYDPDNNFRLNKLIEEGLDYGYQFPFTKDPRIQNALEAHHKKRHSQ